jgi:amino acid adenylation domain-containing protein
MHELTRLPANRQALYEKLLRGEVLHTPVPSASITPRNTGQPAPLSFAQQQMWLLSQLAPDCPLYNECVTIYLPGSLDVDAFTRAFNALIERHEAWRTHFVLHDGEPVQVIDPPFEAALPLLDLRQLAPAEQEREARRLAHEDATAPFYLSQCPLFRARLFRLGDADYRFYITLHHSIFDGFTLYQLLLPELHALYSAYSNGQPSPLPALPIQYADYASWQRREFSEESLSSHLEYWRQLLADAPTSIELPFDHHRPSLATYRGTTRQFTLSASLSDALRNLCREEGVTLYTLLLAAFSVLLYRYSGQDDLLIGTAAGGRNQQEVQGLMGVFINMLVMRTHPEGNLSFREFLRQVRAATIDAQMHQDVPFEYLVRALQPQRDPGQNPLFQALLILEPPIPAYLSGWTVTHLDISTDTSKFDLSLLVEDRSEGLNCCFEYSTDLFEQATIHRMVGHLQTLLAGIIAHPTQSLSSLPLLTQTEQQQLVSWNATTLAYPQDRLLHQLFEVQVERTPDAVALISGQSRLTYAELNGRANRLAHHLQRLGVGPETLAGVCIERSPEMVIALLAILKAGGAYVPLDPSYPAERLAFMLQDSQAAVLLTRQSLKDRVPLQATRILCLDSDESRFAQESEQNPESTCAAGDLAYVIYTSGSTGQPKGVAIEHRSANAFIAWALSVFTPGDLAGTLASTSICFDLSVFELFAPLSCGGSVILAENALQLPDLSARDQVTLVNSVPSAVAELIHSQPLPASVRIVNLAGEPLHGALVQKLYRQATVEKVYNLYGPTEDTTYSTYTLVKRDGSEPTIGRPIANSQAYILDAALQPVPVGVKGELYLGGDGLARGYLNRPQLTAERFILNPLNAQPGARLYRTGDLARYLPDGEIELLGRGDQQVKIRGFRIEMGEIEVTFRQHPAVREAVVAAREDLPGGKQLVAYIVSSQQEAATSEQLRAYLQEKLPHYMLPSAFVFLPALPLTPNGKIDRQALPAPDERSRGKARDYQPPLSLMHYQLIQMWEQLFQKRPIGIKDDFFALGGHSLLAARLFSQIEQSFGIKLPISTLYSGATIEALAEILQQPARQHTQHADARAPLVTVQIGGDKRPFFFLHGDWAGGGFYCLTLARSLDADQPFYVLEPYHFEGLNFPPTFEEIAAAHIAALRSVQPEGPYLLGGFCNGGIMAYEMARQLHMQGQKVDLLALIDPATPAPHKFIRQALKSLAIVTRSGRSRQLDWFLRYLYLRMPYFRNRFVDGAILPEEEQAPPEAKRARGLALLKEMPPAHVLRQQWSGIYRWVAANYDRHPYPGKITYFWSSESYEQNKIWREPLKGKARHASVGVDNESLVFPGTHMSCKTENLPVIAGRLSQLLEEMQAKSAPVR